MKARCIDGRHIRICLVAFVLLMIVGCGSSPPASPPAPAKPDKVEAQIQPPAEIAAQIAAEESKPNAENAADKQVPVAKPENKWLDPSNWMLVTERNLIQPLERVERVADGLRVIAPPELGEYLLMLRHQLPSNFAVTVKLSVLSHEELRGLGAGKPAPFMIEAGFRSNHTIHSVMVPQTERNVKLEVKMRGTLDNVGVYVNGRLIGGFDRFDTSKGNFYFSMHENRGLLIENVEVLDTLGPDSELDNIAKNMKSGMPPGMMGPGMMGPGMMGPGMMPPGMMGTGMMGTGMMPPGMNGSMPPGMMGQDMIPPNTNTRQGNMPGGSMPGGIPNRSMDDNRSTTLQQAMVPNIAMETGAAAEFSNAPVPEPKRTEAFLNYQDWYIPLSGDANQDQRITGNATFDARGNGMGVSKLSTAPGFWILRKVTGTENYRYTLRVTIPQLSGLGGFDRTTQVVAGIFPFEQGAGVSTVLPGPFHHSPREIEFVATRVDGKVTTTLDGKPVDDPTPIGGDAIMGIYLGGDIRLSFYDFVSSDISTPPETKTAADRSPTEIIADCEKSILRIETESNTGKGAGTGFLIDGDGTFITSLYVLAGTTSAKATLTDGTVCEVLGTLAVDVTRDIVIGKLVVSPRPTLKLANQLPRKGDPVTTLGAPLGPTVTATRGVVSGIRSGVEIPAGIPDGHMSGTWLQFDAAVTAGNCGGPILNTAGQVVGMSCLVSTREAQNLNLGISCVDIIPLFNKSRFRSITPLGISVANSVTGQKTALASGVYGSALKEYVEQCRQEYPELSRKLKDTIESVAALIREFEKGQTQIVSQAAGDTDIVLLSGPQGKPMWLFRNPEVKKRQIKRMQDLLRSLTKIRKQLTNANDPESVLQLAMHFGAKLQLNVDKSVGFLTGAKVVEALNKNELAVTVDSTPCVIWLESTKGFDSGEQFLPQAVYVDGTKTVNLPDSSTPTVQVLRPVSEQDLRQALGLPSADQTPADTPASNAPTAEAKKPAEPTPESASEFRTWSDKSGKFRIEAQLESFDGKQVKLKRRDGSVATVPVDKLSEMDQQFLSTIRPTMPGAK